MVDKTVKDREVIKKIKVPKEYTWFVQAILEDSGIVSVSLGGRESLTIFYDQAVESEVKYILDRISEFCSIEIFEIM